MKYNRGNLLDTFRVAKISSARNNKTLYVFATHGGYFIDQKPPTTLSAYYRIIGDKIKLIPVNFKFTQ